MGAEFVEGKLVLKGEMLSSDAKEELMDKLAELGKYEIDDQVIVLPHPDVGENNYAVIRTSTAQIRKSPSIESEMISQAAMGSEIRVLKFSGKRKGGWWRFCQMEDGYLGWMMRSAMVFMALSFQRRHNTRRSARTCPITSPQRLSEGMSKSPVRLPAKPAESRTRNAGNRGIPARFRRGRWGGPQGGPPGSDRTLGFGYSPPTPAHRRGTTPKTEPFG